MSVVRRSLGNNKEIILKAFHNNGYKNENGLAFSAFCDGFVSGVQEGKRIKQKYTKLEEKEKNDKSTA